MERTIEIVAAVLGFSIACAAPVISSDDSAGGSFESSGSGKKTSKSSSGSSSEPAADDDAGTIDPTPTDDDGDAGPSSTPTTTSPADCSSTSTYDSCLQCCDAPTGGQLSIANATFAGCACTDDCASACGGNYCQGDDASSSCDSCLNNICEPQADAQCTSAACMAGLQCLQTSACDSKP